MSETDTKILSIPSKVLALPLTTHLWSLQKPFFVFTALSHTTFMRHVYEPWVVLAEGEGSGQLNYFLPSRHSQDHSVSCSHSLCPSTDITDTVILTPSAGSLLVPHTWMAAPAAPLPSAQLAGGYPGELCLHMTRTHPQVLLNGCSSSTSLTLLLMHHMLPSPSSLSASTEDSFFCPFQHQADLSELCTLVPRKAPASSSEDKPFSPYTRLQPISPQMRSQLVSHSPFPPTVYWAYPPCNPTASNPKSRVALPFLPNSQSFYRTPCWNPASGHYL